MEKIFTFIEFLNEDDGGGGVGFATLNGNGMGNIVAPTVGVTPGSVNQSGSGSKGSGDISAYDTGKKFGLTINKDKKKKKKVKYFTKQSL